MITIVYIGNKLSRHGYTPTTIEVLVPEIESLGVRVIAVSDRLNKAHRLWHMLTTIVSNRHANGVIIDTYSTDAFYFSYACAQLCRLLNIRYIPILHGGNLPERVKKTPGLAKAVFKNSFANVAVSLYLEALLIEQGCRHILIENHIDITQYHYRHRSSIAPNFIWVRSFDKIYNPEMAIKVFNAIHAQYPDATLTMVGPDKDGSLHNCKQLVKSLSLSEHVFFTGKLQKEEWLKIAAEQDVFINTSSFDNLPLSVIEAMALGLIIVSTNAGGLPYLLRHNQNALMSGINEEEQMVANIQSLLSNQSPIATLSETARTTAEKYDWQQVKNKWVKLLGTLSTDGKQ